jgi:hypothetical protein
LDCCHDHGSIRVEVTGRKGVYAVELGREEAERVAQLIGWSAPP